MSVELFNEYFAKLGTYTAPAVKANKLFVANLEKLAEFQLVALRSYTDLGLAQLKAAAEVSDAESLQAYLRGQVETANVVRQKLLDDAKALADLSAGFKAEFDKLVGETGSEFAQKAKAVAPRKTAA